MDDLGFPIRVIALAVVIIAVLLIAECAYEVALGIQAALEERR